MEEKAASIQLYQLDLCQHLLLKYVSLAKISECCFYPESYSQSNYWLKHKQANAGSFNSCKNDKFTHSKALTLLSAVFFFFFVH